MVTNSQMRKAAGLAAAVVALVLAAPTAFAQEVAPAPIEWPEAIRVVGIAVGAAISIAAAALATARAQAAIGAGGTGAMAEKPELFARVLVLLALPEAILVLGFVMGFLILAAI